MIKHHTLRHLRHNLGWTQGHAAQQIGIQQSYLSKLENGQAVPSFEVLSAISNAYGCDLKTLAPLANYSDSSHVPNLNVISLKKLVGGSILCILLAGLLFSSAWFGLFTSNTAYTYQILPGIAPDIVTPTYLVTDDYRGEKFEELVLNSKVGYVLIGERDISPFGNKLLYVIGLLLFIVGTALTIVGLYLNRKN
ncbi:helix-turn-helix domain-containing protein [Kangiella aquimarina]|uniref:Helix-turn-helix transcriptional regulator n=1 Tax=Kangiella aquimarina TaxID=261965 RepID=A0ABZ0X689_9GAMM|nr:helix-turn-helix transcriptional regulator [Kangiella aquimarina]WQG85869.1 helix-turn-helix transcriptional regulator [Kangiella aquimarina]